MKKTLFLISLFIVLLISCDKENSNISNSDTFEKYKIGKFELPKYLDKTENLIYNEFDQDDNKINQNLLEIAKLMQEYMKEDQEFKFLISKNTNKSNGYVIKFKDIFANVKKSNSPKLQALMDKVNSSDFSHHSVNPNAKIVDEDYDPAVFIPNMEIADFSEDPIIAAGIEINDELPGYEDYEDYIIAEYNDEVDGEIQLLLDETTATTITKPVLIVVNDELNPVDDFEVISQTQTTSSTYALSFKTYSYKINHRYDTSTRSEYEITGVQQGYGTGYFWQGVFTYNGYYVDRLRIDKVHKDNIGKVLTSLKYATAFGINDINQKYVFWNTYEYDWYASYKKLGDFNRNNSGGYLRGRMKYSSDWYSYDPSTLNNNPLNLSSIKAGGITLTYSKGMQSFAKN